jgi:hypothetical protein
MLAYLVRLNQVEVHSLTICSIMIVLLGMISHSTSNKTYTYLARPPRLKAPSRFELILKYFK